MPNVRSGVLNKTVNGSEPHLSRVAGEYRERPPAVALRHAVRGIWRNVLRPTGRPLLVVPDGCIDLLWTGDELLVAGPDTRPIIEAVAPDATIVGVRFHPGAAIAWLHVSAAELQNRRVPLHELWGQRGRQLAEQLFDVSSSDDVAAVLERSLSARMPDERHPARIGHDVRRALEHLPRAHETYVRDVAADLAINERTLLRRCHELFGYGPKTFARILRFQRFMIAAQRADHMSLSTLASVCGYADQAHLSREVRRLSGLTPSAIVEQLAPTRTSTIRSPRSL